MASNWRIKTILLKIESAYGTDPTPTGALNAIQLSNVSHNPMEGQDVSRNLDRAFLGAQQQFPTGLIATLTGETELIGHATPGTPPAWGPLARIAAMAQVAAPGVSVTYNPISGPVFESGTIWFDMGGTRQIMLGCRATGVVRLNTQAIPVIAWTITGLWTQPTDQAPAVPVLTAWQEPLIVNKANTPTFMINGVTCNFRNLELDLANQVTPRLLANYEEVVVTDSAGMISTQIEAVALATLNPFALAKAQTSFAVNLVHGVGAGKIVTINAPTCRMLRLQGYAQEDNIVEWPLRISPQPNAGNDQYTITLT